MNADFDYFFLDGFGWTDLLDFLSIPHYSNEHRDDVEPQCYEIRTVVLPNDIDDDLRREQLLVVWPADKPRPTDAQIAAAVEEDIR